MVSEGEPGSDPKAESLRQLQNGNKKAKKPEDQGFFSCFFVPFGGNSGVLKSPPLLAIPGKNDDQNHFQNPFQIETPPSGGGRKGRLLDLSYPAKGRQCQAPLPGHDDG
jgi:hypothetical protein